MRNQFILLLSFCLSGLPALAQISLDNGYHNLEISGMLSAFYNKRFYSSGNPGNRIEENPANPFDKSKDRFSLRDMQIQFEGRVGRRFEYEFQVDFADLLNQSDIGENPGILDAHATWKPASGPHLKVGYQKIPYSRNSLVPFSYSPYWQRAEISRGEVFSRRDVGVVLSKSLWKQRVNLYGGVFSGMGEQILSVNGGENDPSGTFEYTARIDMAWPSRFRYGDYDINRSSKPMFQAGFAARSVYRRYSSFLPGDDYYLRVMAGSREGWTADLSGQWKGFSAQVEIHRLRYRPADRIDTSGSRFREERGTRAQKIGTAPTAYFLAGGLIATLSYSSRKLKSVISLRYDHLNPNDLVAGNSEQSLTFAYAYLINGFQSAIKAQYSYRLADRSDPAIQRFDDQLRVGWQFMLR